MQRHDTPPPHDAPLTAGPCGGAIEAPHTSLVIRVALRRGTSQESSHHHDLRGRRRLQRRELVRPRVRSRRGLGVRPRYGDGATKRLGGRFEGRERNWGRLELRYRLGDGPRRRLGRRGVAIELPEPVSYRRRGAVLERTVADVRRRAGRMPLMEQHHELQQRELSGRANVCGMSGLVPFRGGDLLRRWRA
jgi:hypothetical protein